MTNLGLALFGESPKQEEVVAETKQPIALDAFSKPEPLPLDLFSSQDGATPVRSTAERNGGEGTSVPSSFADKASFAFDIGVRTPAALAFGMASWPFAQAARFGAIGGQKAQQALGLVPEMTNEQITELGNQTAEWFSSLGGTLTPKTETGKRSLELAGKVVEPIGKVAHWINSGIDREQYPHLGALADTTTEGMMFAFLHKFGTEAVDVGKRQLKTMEKNGQAKVRAAKKMEERQTELLTKAEEAAKVGELQKVIEEKFTGEAFSPERKALIQNQYEVSRTEIVNSGRPAKEVKKELSKLDKDYKTKQKEMTAAQTEFEKFQKRDPVAEAAQGDLTELERLRGEVGQDRISQQREINQQRADFDRRFNTEDGQTNFGITPTEPVLPTKSELSQGSKGFESGEIPRPDLRGEPVSGLKTGIEPTTPTPPARVEFLSDEGIPRATYQVENGKLKEVERVGEQKTYQIDPVTKKIELVEDVPGQRQVWKVLLDPLKNESGSINIGELSPVIQKLKEKYNKLYPVKGSPYKLTQTSDGLFRVEGDRLSGTSFLVSTEKEGIRKIKKLTKSVPIKGNNVLDIGQKQKSISQEQKALDAMASFDEKELQVYSKRIDELEKQLNLSEDKKLLNHSEVFNTDNWETVAKNMEELIKSLEKDTWKGFHVTKAQEFNKFRDDVSIPSSEGVYFWPTRELAEQFKGPNERIIEVDIKPGRTTTIDTPGNVRRGSMSKDFDTARGPGMFGEEIVVFNMDNIKIAKPTNPIFKILTDPLKNETGSVDIKPLIDLFGKAPKAGSLLNRLLKEGLSKDDLTLSGIGGYLAERKQKPVDWNEIKKLADEGGFGIKKEIKLNIPHMTSDQLAEFYNIENTISNSIYDSQKYQSLNLPGGKKGTYKENIYRFEGDTPVQEHHLGFGENELMHSRTEQRTVKVEGKDIDTLHGTEFQSTWHKIGQTDGYADKAKSSEQYFKAIKEFADKNNIKVRITAGEYLPVKEYSQLMNEAVKQNNAGIQQKIISYYDSPNFAAVGVPNAPFKKTWSHMLMRDMIQEAVEKDLGGISWDTGKIQVDRYAGKEMPTRDAVYDKTLPEFFKKEFGVDARLVNTTAGKTGTAKLNVAKVKDGYVVESWDNGVRTIIKEFSTREAAREHLSSFLKEKIDQVWYVPITKKMRKMYSESAQTATSIFETLIAPLRNEDGFIRIPFSRKDLLEKTSPAFRDNVRKFGELAEKSGKTMAEFLKANDFSDKEIKQMMKVAEAVKLERPFSSPKADTIISAGKDPLKLQPGEVNVNTGSKANPKTAIGNKFFEGIRKVKEIKLPPILQAITPALHTIKDMKSPEMTDMWHKVKEIEGNRLKDIKILKDTTLALRDQYPKRKLREEAFVKIMSQDKLGREALVMLDIKPIDGPIKYEGLVGELNGQFKSLFDQLNTMRSSIGKTKIAERTSYLPMIAQENFYSQMRQLFKGQEGEINHPNMVLDSVQAINQRHSPQAVEATALRHLKRRGLREGVKLETDPLKLLAQYGSTAYKHIHYSPFNMFVNQLTTGKFKVKNSAGKEFDWTMANQKPELHEFLSRWSNALAGKPNLMHGPALRFLESGAQKLSSNLTAAVLGWSARTILVQPTALLPTATEFGVTPTVKGLMRTAMRSKKDPINRSQELPNRIADASMSRDITSQLKNPAMRALSLPAEKALSGMKFVDYIVAESTWRTAFDASKHLGESTSIRLADEAVVRTQGSGFVGDLSPIQMNALGKAVTLWQTFTINNMNWVGREVLNIKHPERNPAETARRVATYVIGTALINTLFEDQLGIQSPQPAPIKEMIRAAQKGDSNFSIAYQGLKEMTELAPFLSSLKFGSSPAGAVAEFLKELSNAAAKDLPKALNGDKEAMKRVGFVAAKLTGVPGTQQVKRLVNGTPLGFPVEKIESSSEGGTRTRTRSERAPRSERVKTTRQRRN